MGGHVRARIHLYGNFLQYHLSKRGFMEQRSLMDRHWKTSLTRVKIQNLHLVRAFDAVIVWFCDIYL